MLRNTMWNCKYASVFFASNDKILMPLSFQAHCILFETKSIGSKVRNFYKYNKMIMFHSKINAKKKLFSENQELYFELVNNLLHISYEIT